MKITIKLRIYFSFLILGVLFVLNGFFTVTTLYKNKQLADYISGVVEPSLKELDDFHSMLVESKMYSTNWVFLRSSQADKDALKRIHQFEYNNLKSRLQHLSARWKSSTNRDSLQLVFRDFEKLLLVQQKIMGSLQRFSDYDDPVLRLEAEKLVEDELIPLSSVVNVALDGVTSHARSNRIKHQERLESLSEKLRMIIGILALSIICLGLVLSRYLTGIIVKPINRIRSIINDLGKGITNKIDHPGYNDEIGKMIQAVNHLSEKLQYTAGFAQQVGRRNFDAPFQPLSEDDTLGKALVAMRDNLRSVDESLNQAQHIAHLGSWEWDVPRNRAFWSDEMYAVLGQDPAVTAPSLDAFLETVHPDDYGMAMQVVNQCMMGQQSLSYECRILTSDGGIKTVFSQCNVSFDNAGNIIKLYGIVQDITKRIESEREIKKFNERFHRLSKATNDAIWDWDLVTEEVWWSENFFNTFDYRPSSGVPQLSEWTMKLHPEDRPKVIERLRSVRNSDVDSWEDEFRYIKDGVYGTALDRAYVIKDEEGRPVRVIGAIQDITARKTTEQQIADKNEELKQKNRELEQFAYVTSHDLQEPLRTISSFVERFQLQYKDKLDDTGQKYLHFIYQGSDRMKTLIKDLLDYSRIGRKKEITPIDCNEVLSNVLADLDTAIQEAGVEIEVAALPVIKGYATEMKQLFQNLISNAIKFRKKDEKPKINIKACALDGFWQFSVSDNGIGIEPQHNERIFVIFQRLHTRTEYEGSGIGLSHCKKIVELHGGKIWVDSAPDNGSTFYFTILDNQIV